MDGHHPRQCRLHGVALDLDSRRTAMMEWSNHAITLQASGGCDNPREEVDLDVQVHESCDVGFTEMLRE